MQTVKAFRGNARTFLTHMFGRGLDDDRYVIERFQSKADGEIRPRRRNGAEEEPGKGFPRGRSAGSSAGRRFAGRARPCRRDPSRVCE